uniref:Large ribosomal subunit protein uL23m n=1 Tax=Equus caballus TaxID=9796 RepID=A0A3Q2GXR3_HORSE
MARNVLYPLYQLGNPQLRVFRTNFFIRLVRPGTAQPEDTVQFRIPMEMTRVDLRNYLERIYNVPVAAVRTRVQHGSNRKRDHRNVRIKKPDYKVAYVQLGLPSLFGLIFAVRKMRQSRWRELPGLIKTPVSSVLDQAICLCRGMRADIPYIGIHHEALQQASRRYKWLLSHLSPRIFPRAPPH